MTFAVCSVVAGLVLLFLGAEVMIRGAVALSRGLKVSPHVIGLTVIAFGTSAPELFVSMKAALSGAPAIAVGNVVGSNLANILLMIGTVGVIAPIACASPNLRREGAALVAATHPCVASTPQQGAAQPEVRNRQQKQKKTKN